jgi:flavin reductase (DIM6/NTAB) family NADH-FMN oxidoreductase RutF
MPKFILTKKRSSSWETIKEGESIVIEVSSSTLHYSDVSRHLEKIGKKPQAMELN